MARLGRRQPNRPIIVRNPQPEAEVVTTTAVWSADPPEPKWSVGPPEGKWEAGTPEPKWHIGPPTGGAR